MSSFVISVGDLLASRSVTIWILERNCCCRRDSMRRVTRSGSVSFRSTGGVRPRSVGSQNISEKIETREGCNRLGSTVPTLAIRVQFVVTLFVFIKIRTIWHFKFMFLCISPSVEFLLFSPSLPRHRLLPSDKPIGIISHFQFQFDVLPPRKLCKLFTFCFLLASACHRCVGAYIRACR